MDIQAALICVGLFVLSVVILLFISMIDMHKKTYEEAIAEQRKMPEDSLLLGRGSRDKNKDKKQKRQGKKVKEKPNKPANSKESAKAQAGKAGGKDIKKNKKGGNKEVKKEAGKEVNKDLRKEAGKEGNKDRKKENGKDGNKDLKKDSGKILTKDVKRESGKDLIKDTKKDSGKDMTKDMKKDSGKITGKENNKESKKEAGKSKGKDNKRDNQVLQKEHSQTHVNFVNPEAEILNLSEPPADAENQKKKKKKKGKGDEEIKPILVNKEEPVIVSNKPVVHQAPANHFTKSVPKDDLRLKLSNKAEVQNSDSENVNPNANTEKDKEKSGGKSTQKENSKNNNEKKQKVDVKPLNNVTNNKNALANISNKLNKSEKSKIEQASKVDANDFFGKSAVEQITLMQRKGLNQQVNNKDQKSKKNKKNELTSLQQISEKDSINVQHLVPLIRKADLSRTEVQLLTDVLLNKHTDNELANHSEWIEGRQDPVVKLKKQLAEKEKALTEEQEASQAFQNKLKELRSEYNAERARLSQACRQYEETIMAKQNEISNLHARGRHVHESHVSEKQALTQKLQQLQAQINDENMVIRKLQEENSQTHNALQKELVSQRQQMEMHMARIKEQHQEAENNLKAQIHAQLQEMEQLTASFNAELQKNRRNEEEIRDLREQHIQNQNKIKSLESRASQLKESSSHTQELSRQIEDLQRANKELEKRLSGSLKMEEEMKFEKIRLQNDLHAYTGKLTELQNELDKEKEKLGAQILSKIEVEKEFMRLKEENQNLISQMATFTKIEKEAQQLREENENLAAQMTAFTERPAADGRENGDSLYNEDQKKNINIEFINYENESMNKGILAEKLETQLHQNQKLLDSLNAELSENKSEIAKLNSELLKYKTEVARLHEELEQQRNKNNDIHRRNWKAMEALANTEKSLENEQKKTEKLINERLMFIQQQEMSKGVLNRLFPDISIDEPAYEKWLFEFEGSAKQYLNELSSSLNGNSGASEVINELETKNSQLQALVTQYKSIIDDTEGMLSDLESHIDKDEIQWNQELEKKDLEITTLKKEYDALNEIINSQMQTKINDLEKEITKVREELEIARRKYYELEQQVKIGKENIEQLSEERDSLNTKLMTEMEKTNELNKEVVKLKNLVKIGEASYEEEHKVRVQLEEELKLVASRNQGDSSHSVKAEVSASEEKPKPRKAKWPISGWFTNKLKRRKISNRRRKSH